MELLQCQVHQAIFGIWKLYPRVQYGCAVTWMNKAITVSVCMIQQQVLFIYASQDSIPHSVQAWFGIQHDVVYECSSGHTFQEPAEQPRHPFTPRIQDLRQSARRTPDGSPLLSDVLSHLVPYRLTNKLPIHLQSSITCHNEECQDLSKVISVTTHWPQILQITLRPEGPDLQLEETLHIGDTVEYKLVGCVFFNRGGSHFFSHLFVGGQLYQYDDLVRGGKLQEFNGGVFDYDPTFIEINALFYNRVSVEGVRYFTLPLSKLLTHHIGHQSGYHCNPLGF